MRAADFESIAPDAPLSALPATLVATTSRSAPFLLLALAMPAAIAGLAPLVLVMGHAFLDASIVTQRSGTTAALAAALAVWLVVFAWPIAVRAARSGLTRCVEIADGEVHVIDTGLFGTESWTQPLAAYHGLTHRVRSSLSGVRHELILIHPISSRNILVRVAPRIAQHEIERSAFVLGCREIAQHHGYGGRQFGNLSAAPAA